MAKSDSLKTTLKKIPLISLIAALALIASMLSGCFGEKMVDYAEDTSLSENTASISKSAEKTAATPSDENLEHATLIRVVDGDTLIIDRGYGDERLRLIGIDTPESVHPDASKNTEQGSLASENTKVVLEGVTELWLEKDKSDTDRYGRLLRYVWLTPDTNDIHNMLNAKLVADGWAIPKQYKPDTAYADVFDAIANNTYGW